VKPPPSLVPSTSLGARGSPMSQRPEITKASHQSLRKDFMTSLYYMIYFSLIDEYAFSGKTTNFYPNNKIWLIFHEIFRIDK
jgi:hypothetical protein